MHTDLKLAKVRTVAWTAKFFVDTSPQQVDKVIEQQMVREGIRKIHDAATSFRGTGKYCGHAHWSLKALELLRSNGGRITGITDELAHEHVVPVSVLVGDILFANRQGTELRVYEKQICEFSIVAIIRDFEHDELVKEGLGKNMPKNWQVGCDPWARYVQVGLNDQICSDPTPSFKGCK